jgi:hypothetical protein
MLLLLPFPVQAVEAETEAAASLPFLGYQVFPPREVLVSEPHHISLTNLLVS